MHHPRGNLHTNRPRHLHTAWLYHTTQRQLGKPAAEVAAGGAKGVGEDGQPPKRAKKQAEPEDEGDTFYDAMKADMETRARCLAWVSYDLYYQCHQSDSSQGYVLELSPQAGGMIPGVTKADHGRGDNFAFTRTACFGIAVCTQRT